VAFEIDKAVRQIIDDAHKQATEILTEHKKDVTLIANTLLEKETITAEEIDSLIKTGALPQKVVAKVQEKENLTPEEAAVVDGKISPEAQIKDENKPVDAPKAETAQPAEPAKPEEPKTKKPAAKKAPKTDDDGPKPPKGDK
jgi:cell division protease FtsH